MGVRLKIGKKVLEEYKGETYEAIEKEKVYDNPLGILNLADDVEENDLWFSTGFYREFLEANNLTEHLGLPLSRLLPIWKPLTGEIATAVLTALEGYKAKHPNLIPAYCVCPLDVEEENCSCGAKPCSGTLASLMRLDYWMKIALETLAVPYILFE